MQFRTIPLAQRQDIFFKLVTLQDAKSKGIRESKKIIIDQFQIDDATLEKITEEGMDRNWPPLSDNEEENQVADSDMAEPTDSTDELPESTASTDEVSHSPEA
ncbi:hypothetical protein EBS67_01880 [bacterium]|nr:hypothetical protein [Gemmataceae bacterium]NBS88749.1 hypothetical protein [bacterium]NBT60379.1 hypothetical protein [Planctomycetia bacterium]